MTALPGTPSIQNAIPMPYFKTTAFAAPLLGTIGAIIMAVCGVLWLNRRNRILGPSEEALTKEHEVGQLPHYLVGLFPLIW